MGIAAYNRGNALISKQLRLSPAEQLAKDLDDLNALPKNAKAVRPWGPCEIVPGHGGWWVACPHTGYGYWYKTLRRAVADYRVVIVGVEIRNGEICYRAVPA